MATFFVTPKGHVPILEYAAQVRENCATISDGVTRILNPPITHYGLMLSLLHVPAPSWGVLFDKKMGRSIDCWIVDCE